MSEEEIKQKEQKEKSSTSEEDFYTDTDTTATETEMEDIPDSYPPCGQDTNLSTQQQLEMEEKSVWARMTEKMGERMIDWSADYENEEWK